MSFPKQFLLLVFIFGGSIGLSACSCNNSHTPLEDMICYADTTGGLVLELRMTSRSDDSNEARFRIVDVHVGNTNLRVINLAGRTSCAWYMNDEDQPDERFLYFTHPDWIEEGEGSLFACALNSNIYRMNQGGSRVEYPVGVNGQNTRLAYRDYPFGGCSNGGISVNPFHSLVLTNNPGSGLMGILNSTGEMPQIASIDIFNGAGQVIRHFEPERSEVTEPIDIRGMPTGVYFVVFRQGIHLRTLRYVKR